MSRHGFIEGCVRVRNEDTDKECGKEGKGSEKNMVC